jgi:hypothetical protein
MLQQAASSPAAVDGRRRTPALGIWTIGGLRIGDAVAGAQCLVVVRSEGVREQDQLRHPRVGHLVIGVPTGPARFDVAAIGQAGQVGGDPALGQAHVVNAFCDGVLVVHQKLQQPQPGRIPESAKELRYHGYSIPTRRQ